MLLKRTAPFLFGRFTPEQTKRIFAASFGHFSIDVLNSSIAMILVALTGTFDLSVSQIGFAAMIYQFGAALSQPFFGILADHWRGRWLGALGLLWTAIFYAAIPFMPSYVALVICMSLGSFGSGALHPAGMVNASAAGGRFPTTSTSIFFLFGQTGLSLGPFLAGLIIQTMGITGLPYLTLAMIPAVYFMFVYLRQPLEEEDAAVASPLVKPALADATDTADTAVNSNGRRGVMRQSIIMITAFILLIVLRSGTLQGFVTLLPKLFDDMGIQPATYGAMIATFTFAGALGTYGGGFLGDRYNRRVVICLSTLGGVPFAYIMLNNQTWVFFLVAAAAGALFNVPHSILLVMAQKLLPKRKGLIGGAVLGLMFASGAVMTWAASIAADYAGLPLVLTVLVLLPIGAALSALVLPSTRGVEPQLAPVAAEPTSESTSESTPASTPAGD
ncbi:MAG: MFS transporter [Litorilinea sp.]